MSDLPAPDSSSRIVELDALRGLAAIAVLIHHLPRGFWFGGTGVDLFFVLSGFLITGIILRNHSKNGFFSTFYWRRSLRIFPIYYLALFVTFTLNLLRSHPAETTGFPYFLVYLQNVHAYWGDVTPPTNISLGHTWTLAIEEQFYLFWPIAIVLIPKRLMPWLFGLFVVLPVALRYAGLPRTVLLAHTDGLALGALLAWIMLKSSRIDRVKKARAFATVALTAFACYWTLWVWMSTHQGITGKVFVTVNSAIALISLAYFGLIGFVVCMTNRSCLAWLRNRWLTAVGTISYGLYLYHWIIYEKIDTVIKFGMRLGDPWWLDVIKVSVSVGLAVLSWRFIEKPILHFKDRFSYSDGPVATSPAVLSPAIEGPRTS